MDKKALAKILRNRAHDMMDKPPYDGPERKEEAMYKYHVHAMYFDGNTHHWDGLVTRSAPVLSGDDYDDCKRRLVADAFPELDEPSKVIINSMSPIWPNPYQTARRRARREV